MTIDKLKEISAKHIGIHVLEDKILEALIEVHNNAVGMCIDSAKIYGGVLMGEILISEKINSRLKKNLITQ